MSISNLAAALARLETDDDTPPPAKASTPLPPPCPPGLPLVGNLAELDRDTPLTTFLRLADTYGPIYSLQLGGGIRRVFINSVELLEEVCDESRFRKVVSGSLVELRAGTGAGLFTAHHGEHEWAIAHRILMPAFGPMAIREMFDDMHDIASQLVMKWARYGPQNRILATDDFTRLTLDTLALCTMDYRFNSFYQSEMHEFVDAMVDFLVESGKRANRPKIAGLFLRGTNMKYDADIKLMKDVAAGVIKARREKPSDKKDLLNAMINGRDPKTGEGLSDDLIIANMITFLIAGHETTSGMLSFAFYGLLRNSSAYRAAQQEVDEVCGKGPITVEHIPKLKYIAAVLRETLRLNPTASIFAVSPHPDLNEDPVTIGNGKYALEKGQPIHAVLPKIHRDPKVYGDDAEEFRPERMLDENFEKLPSAAWKPFGNGMRGCIGRPFAWQEAILVTALLLQNFNFQLDDPNYRLQIKQTLTIKPKDFYMRATLRDGVDPIHLEKALAAGDHGSVKTKQSVSKAESGGEKKPRKQMSIFYGSNTGTCETLAQRLSTNAVAHGFDASVAPLDSATEKLSKDRPVVIITASYEGQPPDNAAHFVEWLQSLSGDEVSGTNFAVFGCGHKDWRTTFQRIPNLVDDLLEARGGHRIVKRGLADASTGDMFTEFDSWEDGMFWPAVTERFGGGGTIDASSSVVTVEISSQTRSSNLRIDVRNARVKSVGVLTTGGEKEKHHIEIELPSDMPYRAGDYLAVLPVNPKEDVKRAMKRFQLPWDAQLKISSNAPTSLPTNCDISARAVLDAYVELSQPATKKNVLALAAAAGEDHAVKAELEALAAEKFQDEITAKRTSPLDLLERYPKLNVPIGDFLAMLPPMRVRQYSMSSSPLQNPETCTLTYSRVEGDARSGAPRRHLGVATSYLASLEPGDILQVSVRASAKPFHLPLNPETTPIVMICAGTGLAPFRGFVQERAVQIAAGRKLAKALLFVGCRYHDRDRLYADEFDHWEKQGAVELRYAFSREPEASLGCRYVQDRMRREKDELHEAWESGAKVFVCGGAKVGEAVAEVCKELYRNKAKELGKEKTEELVEEWFAALRNERFATDVFD